VHGVARSRRDMLTAGWKPTTRYSDRRPFACRPRRKLVMRSNVGRGRTHGEEWTCLQTLALSESGAPTYTLG
jgi:hypothetical protein